MSEQKKSVYKPRPVSGFPEWLPEVRIVEQQWFDHIRRVFEAYGFCSIETPSVEELDVIAAKGEVDKEIYVLERLHRDENDKEARLALHFDQTVPLARYVAQHFNDLTFPFKRYQMQRVWRGERPQAGRFREFYQCDIDVIGVDSLPLHFDAEMPAIMYEVMRGLPGMEGQDFQIQLSNRKILIGALQSLGVDGEERIVAATRAIDKLEKIGREAVAKELAASGLSQEAVSRILKMVEIRTGNPEAIRAIKDIFPGDFPYLDEGIAELCEVLQYLQHLPEGAIVADLAIVRGLDYYTGTVYETRFTGDGSFGSICSGGRYEDLATQYINKKLPGVGISIGFSRLFSYLHEKGALPVGRKSPAHVLVAVPSEERRGAAAATAHALRGRGFNVELYHAAQKLQKQLAYAEKKGIPYVWFPPFEEGQAHEVKCLATRAQAKAEPETWNPAKEELDAVA
jgi:histidyl-tRNA synthetase